MILYQFADWEYAFLATSLQDRIQDKSSPYEVKTVSLGTAPVRSLGSFAVVADYNVRDCPDDYEGLVLIGGPSWRGEAAKQVKPLLTTALADGKVVGAICDATVFLGMNGLLNEKQHTGNTLEDLSAAAGARYTGRRCTGTSRQCGTGTWSPPMGQGTWNLQGRCWAR